MPRTRFALLSPAVVALAVLLAGCGDESTTGATFTPLTGEEVIAATRAERTAEVTVKDQASVADPGTDHGTSGLEEEDQTYDVIYDFERNRSVVRWEFPAFDGEGFVSGPGDEAMKVEARSIGKRAYVRDGSWLCPGCGLDDDEPLPSDKWITVPLDDGDKAFDFSPSVLSGQLGWLELVNVPVEPGETLQLDGTLVAVYKVRLSADDATRALPPSEAGYEYPEFQGDDVAITFWVDEERRLRKLVVEYKVEDRTRTATAVIQSFGSAVVIDVPPNEEIFDE